MALNTLQLNTSTAVAGLGTSLYNIVIAGIYNVTVSSTLPLASGLQIVVNQNGSPKLTFGGASTNPTPTQPSISARVHLGCAVNDVITVVLSSANVVDNQPNSVKSIINLYQGE